MKSKVINGYEDYTINEIGEVFSHKRKKPRKLKVLYTTQTRRYLAVILYKENKHYGAGYSKKQEYIHRLVWETFKGEIPQDKEIDHIDGNPLNNDINNLQLITSENNKRKSLLKRWGKEAQKDKDAIIEDYKSGMSMPKIAKKYGHSTTTVWRFIHNKKQICKYKGGKKIYTMIDNE